MYFSWTEVSTSTFIVRNFSATITRGDPEIVFLALRLIGWFASFAIFYVYLRTWFPMAAAMAGTALVAAGLPLTFTNSWAHPDHVAELALFTLGCLTIARGLNALAQSLGRLAGCFASELFDRKRRSVDVDVDAIEEGTADAGTVALDL